MAGMSEKNYVRGRNISSNIQCDLKNLRDKCLNVSFTDERKRTYKWPQMQNIMNVLIACIFNNRKKIKISRLWRSYRRKEGGFFFSGHVRK